jgi:hypothetical protein
MKVSEVNITSPIMRREYRRQIELKQSEKNRPTNYELIKVNGDKKGRVRNVKLNYLPEKPSSEYLKSAELSKPKETADSLSLVLYKEPNAANNGNVNFLQLNIVYMIV